MARDKVKRNVVALCAIPVGLAGRASKSPTLDQAKALLDAAELGRMRGYIVVSQLTGPRTEELRALTWDHVDLLGKPDAKPPVPPSIMDMIRNWGIVDIRILKYCQVNCKRQRLRMKARSRIPPSRWRVWFHGRMPATTIAGYPRS